MRSLVAFLAALACSTGAFAQEVAGRVLLSIGDVAIVRGATTLTPGTGTAVLTGDTIRVGQQSNLQMRMTDESLVALQPGTTLQVAEYAFAGKEPGDQRAIFRLAAGAMRTVTALIGRINKRDYQVQTPTATIGIRGTSGSIQSRMIRSKARLASCASAAIPAPTATTVWPASSSNNPISMAICESSSTSRIEEVCSTSCSCCGRFAGLVRWPTCSASAPLPVDACELGRAPRKYKSRGCRPSSWAHDTIGTSHAANGWPISARLGCLPPCAAMPMRFVLQ